MPSSPQTITTRGVFDYLENTAGKPIVGATINCTLSFNGASVTSPIVNVGELQQSTTTDQNGFWRFALIPNDTLTPTGTLYQIGTPGSTYDISVPSGGADVQSSSILANVPSVLSPALTNLTGPITVTGNETVTGNLSVSGTTTLGSTTAGATTLGATTVGGDLTIGSAFRLLFGAAVSKIVPGATSISLRNNADSADNVLIADAGNVTVRGSLTDTGGPFTLTAGDAIITAGRLLLNATAAKIKGGATSLSLRNNADSADNVLVADAGTVTLRNALSIPPAASGTVAPSNYGSVPVKIAEQVLSSSAASVTFSSLPTGFRNFEVVVDYQGTVAPVDLLLRFNADSGTNYDWNQIESNASGTLAGTVQAAASAIKLCTSNSTAAGLFTACRVMIYNVQGATNKRTTSSSARVDSNGNLFNTHNTGHWRNTAALTSLSLNANANNLAAGSVFGLYGYP